MSKQSKVNVAARDSPVPGTFCDGVTPRYYWDSFEAPLRRSDSSLIDLYLGILGHHSGWMKWLLFVRNRLVAVFGLRGSSLEELWRPQFKQHYDIGEKILRFVLFAQSEREIVTGGNDKHLDFRVSLCRVTEQNIEKIVLSTVVFPHNRFGKAYLLVILPFHRFGVKRLMINAVKAGRV